MPSELPPTIDAVAAQRWARLCMPSSAWLHEEVARRMEERLDIMTLQPTSWVHWEPWRGGMQAHALLAKRYPKSECFLLLEHAEHARQAARRIATPWWKSALGRAALHRVGIPSEPVQMLWANMALHAVPDPMALIDQWHRTIAVGGFLMFSCLGPDSLRELRQLYARMGWPPPSHAFTDMHDWGDMLVRTGFAEPVMDMERITLTFSTPASVLAELRGLGRNLHVQRFAGLRGRCWHQQLQEQLAISLAGTDGADRLKLTFEIVYGHAFKAAPKTTITKQSTISLEQMRAKLAAARGRPGP